MTESIQASYRGKIIVREARTDDVPDITEIWKQLMDYLKKFDSHYSRAPEGHRLFEPIIEGCIANRNSAVFVAETDCRIVGYCMCHLGRFPSWTLLAGKRNGSISDMAVAEDCRRKGIGRELFAEAMKWFAAQGACRIDVESIATGNVATAEFWKKTGFRQASEALTIEAQVSELPAGEMKE